MTILTPYYTSLGEVIFPPDEPEKFPVRCIEVDAYHPVSSLDPMLKGDGAVRLVLFDGKLRIVYVDAKLVDLDSWIPSEPFKIAMTLSGFKRMNTMTRSGYELGSIHALKIGQDWHAAYTKPLNADGAQGA